MGKRIRVEMTDVKWFTSTASRNKISKVVSWLLHEMLIETKALHNNYSAGGK